MQISDVSSYMTSGAQKTQTASASPSIDSNQFFTLLMAQLTHQNPMEPLKDSEMLNQFAQLNSVDELKNIRTLMMEVATANQTGYAASLIGKPIKAALANGKSLEGVVNGITMEAGKVYVHVGNEKALLSEVVEIKDK